MRFQRDISACWMLGKALGLEPCANVVKRHTFQLPNANIDGQRAEDK